MEMDNKMGHFRWIVVFIEENGEHTVWVKGGPSVTSQNIEKNSLNFEAKAW